MRWARAWRLGSPWRTKPRKRAAVLETTLDVLRARRFVQQLRCLLSRLATTAGDLASARKWLELCDPRAEDLYMDSPYRLASATLEAARGNADGVRHHLGARKRDVPVAASLEAQAHELR